MYNLYFTSYRVVSLRAAWVTFDAPGWLDRHPYVFTVIIIIIIIKNNDCAMILCSKLDLLLHLLCGSSQ